jgi:hypothetical protein
MGALGIGRFIDPAVAPISAGSVCRGRFDEPAGRIKGRMVCLLQLLISEEKIHTG